MKSKIVCEQLDSIGGGKGKKYLVTALTNRTNPKIGDELTEQQVQTYITEGRGEVTVDIKPHKRK